MKNDADLDFVLPHQNQRYYIHRYVQHSQYTDRPLMPLRRCATLQKNQSSVLLSLMYRLIPLSCYKPQYSGLQL